MIERVCRCLARALVLSMLAWFGPAPAGDPSDLEALVAAIAARAEHRIEFVEERHNALLAEPLRAQGYLEYVPDSGELLKVVLQPEPARMSVSEKAIVVERDEQRRRIALRKRPELSALFAGMRGLIEGDAQVILRYFDYRLEPHDDGWSLLLKPKHERLQRRLERLVIEGVGDRMESICTELDDGEWQLMSFPREADTQEGSPGGTDS